MRALVVYESMFGNTRAVAEAIAEGMAPSAAVEVVEVGAAPAALGDGIDLFVVGGPTHAFSMSRPQTRQDAATKSAGPLVSRGPGIREWLNGIDPGAGRRAATFDTKVCRPHLPGSAARAAERQLRRRGFGIAAHAATFYVDGMYGPLVNGELDRARQWGARLASSVAASRA